MPQHASVVHCCLYLEAAPTCMESDTCCLPCWQLPSYAGQGNADVVERLQTITRMHICSFSLSAWTVAPCSHGLTPLHCCRFRQYTELVQDKLMPKYNATWHWAKIEVPNDPQRLQNMREALANRFPVAKFNQYRAQLDPDNILGNELVDTLFSKPMPTSGTHGSKA
eukprot:GHRR01020196.1.p1 GENE.GHRR01020196.1~~GHRR01020196.1.p1  ORF type:complete len:167 (-),score=31.99 GHRR01020196.1:445-945(-)